MFKTDSEANCDGMLKLLKLAENFSVASLPSVQLFKRTKKFEIQFHESSRPTKS